MWRPCYLDAGWATNRDSGRLPVARVYPQRLQKSDVCGATQKTTEIDTVLRVSTVIKNWCDSIVHLQLPPAKIDL